MRAGLLDCRSLVGLLMMVALQQLGASAALSDDHPHINIVLYVPSDVEFPPDASERIGMAAEYAENFFVRWMKKWNYPPARERIFDREHNGHVRVYQMKSKFPLAKKAYLRTNLSSEVSDTIVPRYHLGRHRHLWWIWIYYAPPPDEYNKAHGYGNWRAGGSAFINYYSTQPGQLLLDADMGDGFNKTMSLKAAIHELGHAFGLPHIGPKSTDIGVTLMGPTLDAYRRRTHTDENRVCMSEATAAMLWKHPIFSGSIEDRERGANFHVEQLEARQEAPDRLTIRGRLITDIPAHSVIAFDGSPPKHVNYWNKTYVSRIDPDGSFLVDVTEPFGADGHIRLYFCFENGEIARDKTIEEELHYHVVKGSYDFNFPDHPPAWNFAEVIKIGLHEFELWICR